MRLQKMKLNRTVGILIAAYILIFACFYNALLVLPPVDILGDSYRIFFFHFPNAIVTYLAFTITLVASILYLLRRDLKYDSIASSSAKLGLLFCTLTLVTGAIFSNAAWGRYWNWDPRQTTVLVLWFVYAAYFSLRSAMSDEDSIARISAILGIFGYASVPLTYLSTQIWFSLHPTSGTIGLSSDMWAVLRYLTVGMSFIYLYFLWWDYKFKSLKREYEDIQSLLQGGN
ncbi:MAG: cytochrome c biogenesis protein CcsA [Halobacteriota archaeon]|nr:cytochrome c biogenesis protein CcsA [Halobacteriota archaeon]